MQYRCKQLKNLPELNQHLSETAAAKTGTVSAQLFHSTLQVFMLLSATPVDKTAMKYEQHICCVAGENVLEVTLKVQSAFHIVTVGLFVFLYLLTRI